jgi:hypothetical protein
LPNYPNNHSGGGHYIVAIGYQYGSSRGSGYSNVTKYSKEAGILEIMLNIFKEGLV